MVLSLNLKKLWVFVQDNVKSCNDSVSEVHSKVESLEMSLGLANDEINRLQGCRAKMEDTLNYLQSQSMRNNLVFSNSEEGVNEKPEETERILRSFIVQKLKFAQI